MKHAILLGLIVAAGCRLPSSFHGGTDGAFAGSNDAAGGDGGNGAGDAGSSGTDATGDCCPGTCSLGCNPVTCACIPFTPSNGVDPAWATDPAVTDGFPSRALSGPENWHFETDTGRITVWAADWSVQIAEYRPPGVGVLNGIGFAVVPSPGMCAPGIGVFSFATFAMPGGLSAFFAGDNAAAVLAAGAIDITAGAMLSVAGWYSAAGPGGGDGGAGGTLAGGRDGTAGMGCGAGGGADSDGFGLDPGGGGGGFGGIGGSGGDAYLGFSDTPGAAGPAYGSAALSPLGGGSGGGGGGAETDTVPAGGYGGGGGGALQIVSLSSLNIATGGSVHASGGACGGTGSGTGAFNGGGGGGSGGGVLLEAPSITVGGSIAANGGAGCGGDGSIAAENGRPDEQPAQGSGGGFYGGNGGDGSAGATTAGEPGQTWDYNGGGGGGGAGWIRINTMTGTAGVTGMLSPSLSTALASLGYVDAN